jgi:hypothetical protein
MPGTVFELELIEALALVAAAAADPEFLWYASPTDRQMLLQEARRVVEAQAHEAACRCLAPVRCQPNLRLIQGDDHDRRRRRDLTDGRGR